MGGYGYRTRADGTIPWAHVNGTRRCAEALLCLSFNSSAYGWDVAALGEFYGATWRIRNALGVALTLDEIHAEAM